jgi:hypothetical protein
MAELSRAPSKIVHLLAQNQNAVVKVLFSQNMSSTPVEQLHHYVIVSELPRGKVVLEIGLGDGRGSSLVVQAARQIVRMGIMTGLVDALKIVAERDRTLSELTMRLLAT